MGTHYGERRLAASIVAAAVRDYVRVRERHQRNEIYNFLVGETEIGRHWFSQAGIDPLQGTHDQLEKLLKRAPDEGEPPHEAHQ